MFMSGTVLHRIATCIASTATLLVEAGGGEIMTFLGSPGSRSVVGVGRWCHRVVSSLESLGSFCFALSRPCLQWEMRYTALQG